MRADRKAATLTPFGQRLRELRARKNVTAAEMAAVLQVSPAYISALERGQRGRPSARLLHEMCQYFNIIWDEADELKRLADSSNPKLRLDTSRLSPQHARLAHIFAAQLPHMSEQEAERWANYLEQGAQRS